MALLLLLIMIILRFLIYLCGSSLLNNIIMVNNWDYFILNIVIGLKYLFINLWNNYIIRINNMAQILITLKDFSLWFLFNDKLTL